MRADRVEFSWDSGKSSWLLRIASGAEVIQRHCALPEDADEQTLRRTIERAVSDEGYDVDPTSLVRR
jgi:hypothetical protein